MQHGAEAPSEWVVRWAPRIPRGRVLDVACGAGRHAKYLNDLGFDVTAVDRQAVSLEGVHFVKADLEDGSPWPFEAAAFSGIVGALSRMIPDAEFVKLTQALGVQAES